MKRPTLRLGLVLVLSGACWSGCAKKTLTGQNAALGPFPHPQGIELASYTSTGADPPSRRPQTESPPDDPDQSSLIDKAKSMFPGQDDQKRENRRIGQLSMARLAERRGETDQATRMYEALIAQQPQAAVPYHRLGVISAKRGHFSQAEYYFTQAYQHGPPSVELLSDMGYLCFLQDRHEDAENFLRQALAIQGDSEAARNNLALVLGKQKRFAESLAQFQGAVPPAEAHANFAYVLAQQGAYDEALDMYSRSLTLKNDLKPAANAMLQLSQIRNAQHRKAQDRNAQELGDAAAELTEVPDASSPATEEGPDVEFGQSTAENVVEIAASRADEDAPQRPRAESRELAETPAMQYAPNRPALVSSDRPSRSNQLSAAPEEEASPDDRLASVADVATAESKAAQVAAARAAASRAAEKIAAEKIAAQEIAEQELAAEKLAAEKLAAEKLAAEKLAAEKKLAAQRAAEKRAAEQLAKAKATAQRRDAEKQASRQRAAEQAAAQQAQAAKLAAQRRAAKPSSSTPSTSTVAVLTTAPASPSVPASPSTLLAAPTSKSPAAPNSERSRIAAVPNARDAQPRQPDSSAKRPSAVNPFAAPAKTAATTKTPLPSNAPPSRIAQPAARPAAHPTEKSVILALSQDAHRPRDAVVIASNTLEKGVAVRRETASPGALSDPNPFRSASAPASRARVPGKNASTEMIVLPPVEETPPASTPRGAAPASAGASQSKATTPENPFLQRAAPR